MSEYTIAAPVLSKAITVTEFKSDHPQPPAPVAADDSEPTKSEVSAVYSALLVLESTGIGYSGVSRLTGVSIAWTKRIHREMKAAEGVVWD